MCIRVVILFRMGNLQILSHSHTHTHTHLKFSHLSDSFKLNVQHNTLIKFSPSEAVFSLFLSLFSLKSASKSLSAFYTLFLKERSKARAA